MRDEEQLEPPAARQNQIIVEALREAFKPMVERLTSDVEPATIYLPYAPLANPGLSTTEAE